VVVAVARDYIPYEEHVAELTDAVRRERERCAAIAMSWRNIARTNAPQDKALENFLTKVLVEIVAGTNPNWLDERNAGQ